MGRYFARLAYKGTAYYGWQKQVGQITVQETIEAKLSLLLREPVEVLGCGRTDTGVHAMDYVLHFDTASNPDVEQLCYRMNKILPDDIVFFSIAPVHSEAHARFDAISRSYEYRIIGQKDPFHIETAFYYPFLNEMDWVKVIEVTQLLQNYEAFYPFCKSNTDVQTMRCDIREAFWEINDKNATFHISADRFLRGMIRLIVGMCLQVGKGKISLKTVKEAMDTQKRLPLASSAAAHGLYLKQIKYEYF